MVKHHDCTLGTGRGMDTYHYYTLGTGRGMNEYHNRRDWTGYGQMATSVLDAREGRGPGSGGTSCPSKMVWAR